MLIFPARNIIAHVVTDKSLGTNVRDERAELDCSRENDAERMGQAARGDQAEPDSNQENDAEIGRMGRDEQGDDAERLDDGAEHEGIEADMHCRTGGLDQAEQDTS